MGSGGPERELMVSPRLPDSGLVRPAKDGNVRETHHQPCTLLSPSPHPVSGELAHGTFAQAGIGIDSAAPPSNSHAPGPRNPVVQRAWLMVVPYGHQSAIYRPLLRVVQTFTRFDSRCGLQARSEFN